jgi:hypothetical protein
MAYEYSIHDSPSSATAILRGMKNMPQRMFCARCIPRISGRPVKALTRGQPLSATLCHLDVRLCPRRYKLNHPS